MHESSIQVNSYHNASSTSKYSMLMLIIILGQNVRYLLSHNDLTKVHSILEFTRTQYVKVWWSLQKLGQCLTNILVSKVHT